MQIYSFQNNQKIQDFKDRVIDSVDKRDFEEKNLEKILQDTFEGNVDVLYNDNYLNELNLEASHIFGGKHYFIFKQDSFEGLRNKNLKDLRKEGFLAKFADFYESITHEFVHGVYEEGNKDKIDFLQNSMANFLKKPEDKAKLMEVSFDLVQKTLNVYEQPNQVARAVDYQANKLSFDKSRFGKFLHLNLLDGLKDETLAYIEGFKAKKDILGEDALFSHFSLPFSDAKDYISESLNIARKSYLDKYVPVKKLNRYF